MRKLIIASFLSAAPLVAPLAAQVPAVRLLSLPDAQTKPIFGLVAAVRALPGGKLLVNDIQKRQLTLLDPALANPAIVADSAAGTATSYGTRPGGLIAYLGDSTLFVDPAGLSMFIIDPAGKIARVGSVPRSQDAALIGNNVASQPALDAHGRLVYRARPTFGQLGFAAPKPANGGTPAFSFPDPPDSAPLVRVDLTSRKLDTALFVKIAKAKMNVQQTERGVSATTEINPLPIVDEWTVLADGSIAIVRGQDYHVDFVNADGAVASSGKIPYAWQRLSDDEKVTVLDSAKKAIEAARAAAANSPTPAAAIGGDGGGQRMVINMSGGGDAGGGFAQRMMAGDARGAIGNAPVAMVSPADLPDYRPVFTSGAARADADGNLWVRTTAVRAGSAGPIYDVIDRRGELVDRVQIPAGRQIVGFAHGGVVYMVARDGASSWIERTHR
jgi:hypothetical protein